MRFWRKKITTISYYVFTVALMEFLQQVIPSLGLFLLAVLPVTERVKFSFLQSD